MAKQGQHRNDSFDQRKSPGHNHPDRSQTITTGSPKSQEAIERDAREHRDPYRQPQAKKNEWHPERKREHSTHDEAARARADSEPMNEQFRGTPDHRVLPGDQHPEPYRKDLNPDPVAGINHGVHRSGELGPSAYDLKDVHQTWSELSDADLKKLPVLEPGTRLEQGAVYFDLNDPARGEIKAMGNMEAGPDNRYVAKSAVDYQLWNVLIGVENPERLGVSNQS
ncbi:MAG: hypothetical protein AB7P40_16715 [Chloroflexota bacterium]